jgi:hypothetical protein
MPRKLLDQEEAARILGVTSEEIGSLRDRKKLFPYRDGADWKFKQEDVERLRDELRQEKADAGDEQDSDDSIHTPDKKTSGESWDSTLGHVELELNDDLDSILLSEIELGKPPKEGPSTIIGKTEGAGGSDDDMVLADLDAEPPAPPAAKPTAAPPAKPATSTAKADAPPSGGSDLLLAGSGLNLVGSGLNLESSDLNLEGSGLTLTSSSGIGSGISGKGKGSDVKLVASGSDVGKKPPGAGSSDKLFGSDALSLSDDELTLVAPEEPKKAPSAGSSIKLGAEDEDLSVLGGKGGSDVTQSPTDSGIMLVSPSDSGLSLEEPLALGSSAKKLLDMNEDNLAMAAGATGIGLVPGGSKVEDEFQLSSTAEAGMEDSDSGSQVIALDSDEDISSGMFAPVAQAGLVEEDTIAMSTSDVPVMAVSPASAPGPSMMAATAGTLEAPFSTWNVVSLIVCAVFLLLCGMMIFDLLKNMWSWGGPSSVNSSIMDALGNSIGWFDK